MKSTTCQFADSSTCRSNESGFASLTEVIVAAIVFAIATAGILATVSFLKPQSSISAKRLAAAYAAKDLLEKFRAEVHWNTATDDWGEGDLAVGGPYTDQVPCGSLTCDVEWTVTDVFGDGRLRRVEMTITYPP